jgi:hypothetical protein
MDSKTAMVQKLELDAETYSVLCSIAKAAGTTPDQLLKKLAQKYKQANMLERSLVLNFLR